MIGDDDDDDDEPSGLVFGDALDSELSKLKSKYPTSEADYLTAARKRAEAKKDSTNSESTAAEWNAVAKQKRSETGGVDGDWEKSLEEAGNADSQILIPVMHTDDDDDDDDDSDGPEPTLLLF
mmetsp:Transcript_25886/g.43139  ORF Transcript_25886/g.43139 Transcript_25886/m.43139 type:complete len:123 (+) Transcript_25886:777-1145(+)